MILFNILQSLILGLLTPLTAVCVLPLYPGFLSYLANQINEKDSKHQILKLGFLVSFGVISFMIILGLIFTTFLQKSLTNVIEVVSPIAFSVLILISLFLIFNINLGNFMPSFNLKNNSKNPKLNAYFYGFFFGAIILPCNPGFIAAFFTRSLLFISPIESMLNFLAFGIGIALPLLLLSLISISSSKLIISFLIKNKRKINLFSGIIMLFISLYYLIYVF